ncbi:MAG: SH3 domain-containing protein [Chloroflexi bacterium]|nr:SH3 domain-containing protein [Chloroflexota bacterium]
MIRNLCVDLRVGVWAVTLALLLAGGLTESQRLPAAEASVPVSEMTDPLHDVILPRLYAIIGADVSPTLGDATLINRFRFIVSLAMVDAAAPYHPTAVGMYTRAPRRPEREWTNANINTAMFHAAYNALMGLLPERVPVWREMMRDVGLDPLDRSTDLSTAVGIGNAAGAGAQRARLYDGVNQTGDYQDTTGYAPVNSAFELRDPSRWQPGLRRHGIGVYAVQQFVTPQLANTEPIAPFDPRELRVDPPSASDPANWDAYKAQVDVVLDISANLSDEMKLKAELFDNKIASLGLSYVKIAKDLNLSPADIARGYFVKVAAWMDASIATWQEKRRYDAVRPFSAIAYVYGNEPVTTWGGPGQGRQDVPADQWQAYLPEADHPEYPSGSTCGCYAHAQALRRFTGTDRLDWSVSYPAGTSRIEPGLTPARDTTLTFETWTDFASDCGQSRLWGGVHFAKAVEASAAYCSVFGDMAYDYYLTLMDGSAPLRESAETLSPDPWLENASKPAAPVPVVPENTYPTPLACENASESIVVTAMNNGVICEGVDTTGLSQLAGFLDAVVVYGELNLGAQVCFEQEGAMALFKRAGAASLMEELAAYSVNNLTCAWVDQPGMVMLIATSPALQSDGATARDLSDCVVTLTAPLNFRASPGGGVIGLIPDNARLNASERSDDWLKVRYSDEEGWISADFVTTEGACQ